jgi:hypothetical protein
MSGQLGRTQRIGLEEFTTMPDVDADGMSVDELEDMQEQIATQQAHLTTLKGKLERVLLHRYEGDTKRALREKGQDSGTVTYNGNNGCVVRVTVPKLVEWDQDALRGVVDHLAEQNANLDDYVSFVVKVQEVKYKSWPDDIRSLFDTARTVRQGKLSIKIEQKDK